MQPHGSHLATAPSIALAARAPRLPHHSLCCFAPGGRAQHQGGEVRVSLGPCLEGGLHNAAVGGVHGEWGLERKSIHMVHLVQPPGHVAPRHLEAGQPCCKRFPFGLCTCGGVVVFGGVLFFLLGALPSAWFHGLPILYVFFLK